MASLIAVLTVIMTTVNLINYFRVRNDMDNVLNIIYENDGFFPKDNIRKLPDFEPVTDEDGNIDMPFPDGEDRKGDRAGDTEEDADADKKIKMPPTDYRGITKETPYFTRYFSVKFDEDGEITWSNTGSIAAVSISEAKELASEVYGSGNERGYKNGYRYLSLTSPGGEKLVIFLDCQNQMSSARAFLMSSLLICAAGIAAVFVLVVVFSKKAIKPIAESYEKQKRFITDSSHEIKTPLAIISANTEVIEMENGESEWTDSIRNQVERLSSLTQSLTNLARMDEEGIKIEKCVFPLSDAVSESVEPFKTLAESKNRTLCTDIEGGISYDGSEKLIKQLVGILLDNAVKYSNDGGRIDVTLKKQKKNIVLKVSNTVDESETGDLDHMFDRFYRADKARTQSEGGFGIGLSVARSIAEVHGGTISANSTDGKTIDFTLKL